MADEEVLAEMAETIRTVLNDFSLDNAPDRLRGALYYYEMAANCELPMPEPPG